MKKTVGIIIAMEKELEPFLRGRKFKTETVSGKDFFLCEIGRNKCVIMKSGVGKVNAAYATTLLMQIYKPDFVVSTGISGGLGDRKVLDMVVAEKCVQYDMDTTPLGDPLGYVSGTDRIFFEADTGLTDSFIKNSGAVKTVLACGDRFVADKETKAFLQAFFGAGACDMESGAIAQVAFLSNVPFVAIRCISDGADDNAPLTFEEMTVQASEKLSKAVIGWLEQR